MWLLKLFLDPHNQVHNNNLNNWKKVKPGKKGAKISPNYKEKITENSKQPFKPLSRSEPCSKLKNSLNVHGCTN